jgi:hypothetical protein
MLTPFVVGVSVSFTGLTMWMLPVSVRLCLIGAMSLVVFLVAWVAIARAEH